MKFKALFYLLGLIVFIWLLYFIIDSTGLLDEKTTNGVRYMQHDVPEVYSNIVFDKDGVMKLRAADGTEYPFIGSYTEYHAARFLKMPTGTENGIEFDFNNPEFEGILYYGLMSEDVQLKLPVFFKMDAPIENGVAEINILEELSGKYDMTGWQKKRRGILAYRVVSQSGKIIYDGKVFFSGKGPFEVEPTIIEGPFLSAPGPDSVVVWLTSSHEEAPELNVEKGSVKTSSQKVKDYGFVHSYIVKGLEPATKYDYSINYGLFNFDYGFSTAGNYGSRDAFTFAFVSDSRAGKGGGERDIYGTNAYIMKQMMACALNRDAAFLQFTGDMINGYSDNVSETKLQYANWKRAIEPFGHFLPVYAGFGNHENISCVFNDGSEHGITIDRYPFETESSEAIFAEMFVNPENGPASEDGAWYDPNPEKQDFPSYSENSYSYTHNNIAVIVLNSNYWYAPSTDAISLTGGNPHAYIMDNQLDWFEKKVVELESDDAIDHVFVTLHTPMFPNGGHADDDMWYFGNNSVRPWISGEKHKKGILERRDEFIDIMSNQSSKVVAVLCGDEHNYSRLLVNNNLDIYPSNWTKDKLSIERPIYQITNGSAGAPYYSQEKLPWSSSVEYFTTEYALNLFHVDGESVILETVNPVTREVLEKIKLK